MKHTILYIEDNETNADIVTRILEKEGYTIHICDNGADGIDKAQELTPDLLIVDLHLPGMNGFEITRQLRSLDVLNDSKIMLLTADIYSREEGLSAGADEFMAKPIRRKTFLKKVQDILA